MRIEHLAIWVEDIERMREFYLKYFDTTSNEKYFNPKKNFTSYFIKFNDGGCRIELMNRPDISSNPGNRGLIMGNTHFAITVGSKEAVNELTELLRKDGHTIEGEPRTSGDGYYESVISDPEGNIVEIIA
ncbi:VOC family protein [uncultured Dysgonomonas sp.]|nr:VOC family protein [uncultured Dysgonomonas sp.]